MLLFDHLGKDKKSVVACVEVNIIKTNYFYKGFITYNLLQKITWL